MKFDFINSKLRLFLALVCSPAIISALLSFQLINAQKSTLDPGVPLSYWYAAFALMPVLVALVGAVLALELSLLATWQKSLAKPIYATTFAVLWNFVFSYFTIFFIAMGFWDCSPAIYKTVEEFNLAFHHLVMAVPHIIGISLLLCLIPTGLLVASCELVALQKTKQAL